MTLSPRPPRPPRRSRLAPMVLAGWLFADLLLMLALVSMSGQADPIGPPEPCPSPSSASPSSCPSTTPPDQGEGEGEPTHTDPPPPQRQRSLDQNRVEFSVQGGDNAALVRQIRRETERWAEREAAFVLTFGGTIASGSTYAEQVNSLLHEARPEMFHRNVTTENFHDGSAPAQTAELWVYFYTSPT